MKTYDVIAIGNSPKIFIELLKHTKKGKKTLLINNKSNWNITSLKNIDNIENGCFFIDYNYKDYKILSKYLKIKMRRLKFEPYFIFENKLYPISSDFLKGEYNPTLIYNYPKNGLKDIINAIQKQIHLYSIKTMDINISSIFVNFKNKHLILNNKIKTKKLLTGYNLNIKEIKSDKSDLILNNKLTDYFTYLLINIEIDSPLNWNFIDFSFCKKNNIDKKIHNKIIYFEKITNKFIWRVKDLTPFSSLKKKKKQKILCIDTFGWLPKKNYEKEIVIEILNYLKKKNLISKFKIKDYIFKSKKSFSIENSIQSINNLYSPYIKIVNPLFFNKDLK